MSFYQSRASIVVTLILLSLGFQNCTRVNPDGVDSFEGMYDPDSGLVNLGSGVGGLPFPGGSTGGAIDPTNGSIPGAGIPGSSGIPSNIPLPTPASIPSTQPPNPLPGSGSGTAGSGGTTSPLPTNQYETCATCTDPFFSQKSAAEETCAQSIRGVSYPLTISAQARDVRQLFSFRGVTLDEAKAVSLRRIRGTVQIEKSDTLETLEVGSLYARANEVSAAASTNGDICLGAGKVGLIGDVKGSLNIAAKEVGKISGVVGNVRIYGGVVASLENIQGHVCLHDGAVVLNATNVMGGIKNCP